MHVSVSRSRNMVGASQLDCHCAIIAAISGRQCGMGVQIRANSSKSTARRTTACRAACWDNGPSCTEQHKHRQTAHAYSTAMHTESQMVSRAAFEGQHLHATQSFRQPPAHSPPVDPQRHSITAQGPVMYHRLCNCRLTSDTDVNVGNVTDLQTNPH